MPLLPRTQLFGNPTRVGGRISPDGQWLSWIAPRDGVLNVWVAPLADVAKARALTDEKQRPICGSFWAPDSKTVLFINDKGGDENFLLYGVDVVSGKQTAYTPFEKTRARTVHIGPTVKDRTLLGLDDALTTSPLGFTADGKTLYWTASRQRNTAALVEQDVATGTTRVLAQDARADIASALYHPQTRALQAYQVDYLKSEYVGVDPAIGTDLANPRAVTPEQFTITSRNADDQRWLVAIDPVNAPSSTWRFDRGQGRLQRLFVSRPELDGAPLVPMQALELKACDGLTPVTCMLFPDEGHGFARPVNNIAFNAVTENFLGQCLGGRAEPIDDTLKPSSAQVKYCAEFAAGLQDALNRR